MSNSNWNTENFEISTTELPAPEPQGMSLRAQRARAQMIARRERNRSRNMNALAEIGIVNAPSRPFRSLWANNSIGPPVNNEVNIYAGMVNATTKNIPKNSTDLISMETIKNDDEMVNFHNEHKYGHYYRKSNFNALTKDYTGKKKNPSTRKIIEPANVVKYKAKIVGGRRSTRKTKKSKKSKKSRKNRK